MYHELILHCIIQEPYMVLELFNIVSCKYHICFLSCCILHHASIKALSLSGCHLEKENKGTPSTSFSSCIVHFTLQNSL